MMNCLAQCGCIFYFWYPPPPKRDKFDSNQSKGWGLWEQIRENLMVNLILCQSHSEFIECFLCIFCANFGFLMRGSNDWPYLMVNISMWASHKPSWVSQQLGHAVGVISTTSALCRSPVCLKIGLDCHSADFLGTGKIRSCPYLVNNSLRWWCTGQKHQYVCLSAWVTLVPMLTPATSAISTC